MRFMRLVRKWPCAECGKNLVVSTNQEGQRVVVCDCGSIKFEANRETLVNFKIEITETEA